MFLHSKLAPKSQELSPAHALEERNGLKRQCDTHISGKAGRWPGSVSSELSQLAHAAFDVVSEIPSTRWPDNGDRLRFAAVRYVAHVPSAELFDGTCFTISPAEATWMDPQQRHLLQAGYGALHSGGAVRARLLAQNVAVTVGIQATDFFTIGLATPTTALPVYAVSGSTFSVAAGRLSFTLGLQGACYNTDTACSTALVVAHTAATMVRGCECESALTLAVNFMLLPLFHVLVAIAGMTSPDGRCKFLDSRANGYVRSEGVGAALLVPAHDLAPQGEQMASLCGSAVRSDGKSASLTAPNGAAQSSLLRAAMETVSVEDTGVRTTECHGTGTALGDPIETSALSEVLMQSDGEAKTLSGLKANFGHMEPSAGLVGLLKLLNVVSLQKAVAPNAHLRKLNLHVSGALRGVPCLLPVQSAVLLAGECVGGVSSFGYAGTIAHVVLRHPSARRSTAGLYSSPHTHRLRSFLWQSPLNPFVQKHMGSSENVVTCCSPVAGDLHILVANHVVQDRVVFPGMGYLEMACAAASGSALRGVFFLQPLAVETSGLLVECTVSDGRFEVRSGEASGEGDALMNVTVHCSGALTTGQGWQRVEHASVRAKSCSRAACTGALYDGFDGIGLRYGPGYRTLVQAWGGPKDAFARLRSRATHGVTCVHPADLDDALCASLVIASTRGETRLPFAVDDVQLQRVCGELWAVRCVQYAVFLRIPDVVSVSSCASRKASSQQSMTRRLVQHFPLCRGFRMQHSHAHATHTCDVTCAHAHARACSMSSGVSSV